MYEAAKLLFNPWIQSKIRENVDEKVKNENSVFPYSLYSTVNLPAGDQKKQMLL